MNILKILGGIGAAVLAAAGLVVAGRTGLGRSEAEPAETTEPVAGGDAPAETDAAEENEDAQTDPANAADA